MKPVSMQAMCWLKAGRTLHCKEYQDSVVLGNKAGMANVKANRSSMIYLRNKMAQRIPERYLVGDAVPMGVISLEELHGSTNRSEGPRAGTY